YLFARLGLRRHGARRHARLSGRLDRRLGDRVLRRAAAARAPRTLAAYESAEPRPGRALVRPLGRPRRADRPGYARGQVVHLDPRGNLQDAVLALHRADTDRLD